MQSYDICWAMTFICSMGSMLYLHLKRYHHLNTIFTFSQHRRRERERKGKREVEEEEEGEGGGKEEEGKGGTRSAGPVVDKEMAQRQTQSSKARREARQRRCDNFTRFPSTRTAIE